MNITFNLLLLILIEFGYLVQHSESIDCKIDPSNDEGRLKKKLFCNYDKTVRPRSATSNSTILGVKMVVKHFDYIENEQVLEVSVWFSMNWYDSKLVWTPQEFGNLESITESSDTIWMPDIALYNSHIGRGGQDCKSANCIVTKVGRVMCIPPCTFAALCKSNFALWPFDRQNCTLKVGSWVSAGSEINYDVNRTTISWSNHFQHANWRLISATTSKDSGIYAKLTETYPAIYFNFIIERHSGLNVALVLVPALIMVTINLVSLVLSFSSTDRILLIIFDIFIHFSFVQQVSWYVPKNGEECPNVIIFFRDSLIISTIILVESIGLRKLGLLTSSTPAWIDTINNRIIASPVGGFFVVNNNESQKSVDTEITVNDNEKLIETGEIVFKNANWLQFSKIVDRVLLILFIIVYILMVITLIPESYPSAVNLPKIEVENKTTTS